MFLMEAYVVIKASLAPLKAALGVAKSAVSGAISTMEAAFKKLYSISKKIALGAGIYLGIATYNAMQQEKANILLAAALKTTGDYSEEAMKRFKEFATSIQKVTTYGDESILMQMAYAKNLGVTTDKLEEATKAAVGLAAKYSIDLMTAFMLIGRASKGQTQMLTRYGIILDDNLTTQAKFNKLLELGAKAFDLAEAAADTTAGRLTQMKNALGDIGEVIGEPLRRRLKKWAEDIRDWANTHQEGIKRITEAFDRLLKAGDFVISQFTRPLLNWLDKLTGKFANFEAEAKLTDAVWAIGEWADKIWSYVKNVWQLIRDLWARGDLDTAIKYGLDLALAQMEKWGKQAIELFKGIGRMVAHSFSVEFAESIAKFAMRIIKPESLFGKILGYTPAGLLIRYGVGRAALATAEEAAKPGPTMAETMKKMGAVEAREVPLPSRLKEPFDAFEKAIKNEDELIKAKWAQLRKEFELSQLQKEGVKQDKSSRDKLDDMLKAGKVGFVGLREAWQQMAVGLTVRGKDPNTGELEDINDNTSRMADATEDIANRIEVLGTVGP